MSTPKIKAFLLESTFETGKSEKESNLTLYHESQYLAGLVQPVVKSSLLLHGKPSMSFFNVLRKSMKSFEKRTM